VDVAPKEDPSIRPEEPTRGRTLPLLLLRSHMPTQPPLALAKELVDGADGAAHRDRDDDPSGGMDGDPQVSRAAGSAEGVVQWPVRQPDLARNLQGRSAHEWLARRPAALRSSMVAWVATYRSRMPASTKPR